MGSLRTFLVAGARSLDLAPAILLLAIVLAGDGAAPCSIQCAYPTTLKLLESAESGLEEQLTHALDPTRPSAPIRTQAGMEEGGEPEPQPWWMTAFQRLFNTPVTRRGFFRGGGRAAIGAAARQVGPVLPAGAPPAVAPSAADLISQATTRLDALRRALAQDRYPRESTRWLLPMDVAHEAELGQLATALVNAEKVHEELRRASGGPAFLERLSAARRQCLEAITAWNLDVGVHDLRADEKVALLRTAVERPALYPRLEQLQALWHVLAGGRTGFSVEDEWRTAAELPTDEAFTQHLHRRLTALVEQPRAERLAAADQALARYRARLDPASVEPERFVGALLECAAQYRHDPGNAYDRWVWKQGYRPGVVDALVEKAIGAAEAVRWREVVGVLEKRLIAYGVPGERARQLLQKPLKSGYTNWIQDPDGWAQATYLDGLRTSLREELSQRGTGTPVDPKALETMVARLPPNILEAACDNPSAFDPAPWIKEMAPSAVSADASRQDLIETLAQKLAEAAKTQTVSVMVRTDEQGALAALTWQPVDGPAGRADESLRTQLRQAHWPLGGEPETAPPDLLAQRRALRWPAGAMPSATYTHEIPSGTGQGIIRELLQAALDPTWQVAASTAGLKEGPKKSLLLWDRPIPRRQFGKAIVKAGGAMAQLGSSSPAVETPTEPIPSAIARPIYTAIEALKAFSRQNPTQYLRIPLVELTTEEYLQLRPLADAMTEAYEAEPERLAQWAGGAALQQQFSSAIAIALQHIKQQWPTDPRAGDLVPLATAAVTHMEHYDDLEVLLHLGQVLGWEGVEATAFPMPGEISLERFAAPGALRQHVLEVIKDQIPAARLTATAEDAVLLASLGVSVTPGDLFVPPSDAAKRVLDDARYRARYLHQYDQLHGRGPLAWRVSGPLGRAHDDALERRAVVSPGWQRDVVDPVRRRLSAVGLSSDDVTLSGGLPEIRRWCNDPHSRRALSEQFFRRSLVSHLDHTLRDRGRSWEFRQNLSWLSTAQLEAGVKNPDGLIAVLEKLPPGGAPPTPSIESPPSSSASPAGHERSSAPAENSPLSTVEQLAQRLVDAAETRTVSVMVRTDEDGALGELTWQPVGGPVGRADEPLLTQLRQAGWPAGGESDGTYIWTIGPGTPADRLVSQLVAPLTDPAWQRLDAVAPVPTATELGAGLEEGERQGPASDWGTWVKRWLGFRSSRRGFLKGSGRVATAAAARTSGVSAFSANPLISQADRAIGGVEAELARVTNALETYRPAGETPPLKNLADQFQLPRTIKAIQTARAAIAALPPGLSVEQQQLQAVLERGIVQQEAVTAAWAQQAAADPGFQRPWYQEQLGVLKQLVRAAGRDAAQYDHLWFSVNLRVLLQDDGFTRSAFSDELTVPERAEEVQPWLVQLVGARLAAWRTQCNQMLAPLGTTVEADPNPLSPVALAQRVMAAAKAQALDPASPQGAVVREILTARYVELAATSPYWTDVVERLAQRWRRAGVPEAVIKAELAEMRDPGIVLVRTHDFLEHPRDQEEWIYGKGIESYLRRTVGPDTTPSHSQFNQVFDQMSMAEREAAVRDPALFRARLDAWPDPSSAVTRVWASPPGRSGSGQSSALNAAAAPAPWHALARALAPAAKEGAVTIQVVMGPSGQLTDVTWTSYGVAHSPDPELLTRLRATGWPQQALAGWAYTTTLSNAMDLQEIGERLATLSAATWAAAPSRAAAGLEENRRIGRLLTRRGFLQLSGAVSQFFGLGSAAVQPVEPVTQLPADTHAAAERAVRNALQSLGYSMAQLSDRPSDSRAPGYFGGSVKDLPLHLWAVAQDYQALRPWRLHLREWSDGHVLVEKLEAAEQAHREARERYLADRRAYQYAHWAPASDAEGRQRIDSGLADDAAYLAAATEDPEWYHVMVVLGRVLQGEQIFLSWQEERAQRPPSALSDPLARDPYLRARILAHLTARVATMIPDEYKHHDWRRFGIAPSAIKPDLPVVANKILAHIQQMLADREQRPRAEHHLRSVMWPDVPNGRTVYGDLQEAVHQRALAVAEALWQAAAQRLAWRYTGAPLSAPEVERLPDAAKSAWFTNPSASETDSAGKSWRSWLRSLGKRLAGSPRAGGSRSAAAMAVERRRQELQTGWRDVAAALRPVRAADEPPGSPAAPPVLYAPEDWLPVLRQTSPSSSCHPLGEVGRWDGVTPAVVLVRPLFDVATLPPEHPAVIRIQEWDLRTLTETALRTVAAADAVNASAILWTPSSAQPVQWYGRSWYLLATEA